MEFSWRTTHGATMGSQAGWSCCSTYIGSIFVRSKLLPLITSQIYRKSGFEISHLAQIWRRSNFWAILQYNEIYRHSFPWPVSVFAINGSACQFSGGKYQLSVVWSNLHLTFLSSEQVFLLCHNIVVVMLIWSIFLPWTLIYIPRTRIPNITRGQYGYHPEKWTICYIARRDPR